HCFPEEIGVVLILELVTDLTSAKEATDTAKDIAEQPFKLLFRCFIFILVFKFVADLTPAQETTKAADDVAQQAFVFEFRVTVGISFIFILIFKFRVTVLTFWTTVMHRFVSDGCLKKCHNETSLPLFQALT